VELLALLPYLFDLLLARRLVAFFFSILIVPAKYIRLEVKGVCRQEGGIFSEEKKSVLSCARTDDT
jgi:hypothetical protein